MHNSQSCQLVADFIWLANFICIQQVAKMSEKNTGQTLNLKRANTFNCILHHLAQINLCLS